MIRITLGPNAEAIRAATDATVLASWLALRTSRETYPKRRALAAGHIFADSATGAAEPGKVQRGLRSYALPSRNSAEIECVWLRLTTRASALAATGDRV
jgi:hypothetical protein